MLRGPACQLITLLNADKLDPTSTFMMTVIELAICLNFTGRSGGNRKLHIGHLRGKNYSNK